MCIHTSHFKIPFHFSLFFFFLDHLYLTVFSLCISVSHSVGVLEGKQSLLNEVHGSFFNVSDESKIWYFTWKYSNEKPFFPNALHVNSVKHICTLFSIYSKIDFMFSKVNFSFNAMCEVLFNATVNIKSKDTISLVVVTKRH